MYPLVPKSNSKLLIGQFWPIKLSNGKFAAGLVAGVPDKTRSTRLFMAALLAWTSDVIPSEENLKKQSELKIISLGQAHIKAITSKGQAIIGKIDFGLLNIEIPFQVSQGVYQDCARLLQGYKIIRPTTPEDHTIFETQGTWGYDFINQLAELHFGNQ